MVRRTQQLNAKQCKNDDRKVCQYIGKISDHDLGLIEELSLKII